MNFSIAILSVLVSIVALLLVVVGDSAESYAKNGTKC